MLFEREAHGVQNEGKISTSSSDECPETTLEHDKNFIEDEASLEGDSMNGVVKSSCVRKLTSQGESEAIENIEAMTLEK